MASHVTNRRDGQWSPGANAQASRVGAFLRLLVGQVHARRECHPMVAHAPDAYGKKLPEMVIWLGLMP